MDTREFLRRVIPKEGNFLTLAYPAGEAGRPGVHRSYPVTPEGLQAAAGYAQWTTTRRKLDVWHAVASYKIAASKDRRNGPVLEAKRNIANVHLIKCLIIDQDVKRAGDKKSPDHVFADRRQAAQWLYQFYTAIGLPPPNLGVGSGYGLHWYWLLETALTVSEWKPLAEALRRAMVEHGWRADTGPTVDAARLLRPPGTLNYKVPDDPKPVTVLPQQAADYPNAEIVQALTPWLEVGVRATGTGGASVHQLGPKPAYAQGGAGLSGAASEGVVQREFLFSELAKHCLQAAKSLAEGGNGESYDLWRSHALTCTKCTDGEAAFHQVGCGDPRYDEDQTNEMFERTRSEAEAKGLGATLCKTYDSLRPGVCPQCPHWGRIPSPLRLGAPASDLPEGYRRMGGTIERLHGVNGKAEWVKVFTGNVHSAQLDAVASGGHQLSFIYELGLDKPRTVAVPNKLGAPATIQGLLAGQGMTISTPAAAETGKFLVAWISKLQRAGAERHGRTAPYGWNIYNGKKLGVAIAGDHYLCAGGEEKIAVADRNIASMYRPTGTFAAWRQAAALFEGKRPDLQIIIGISFAAPLLSLCSDIYGLTWNFFGPASGIGKTSAIKMGQTIWGSTRMMSSMTDTFNAVMKMMSEPKIFPRYWDEFTLHRDQEDTFNQLIFNIPQGRERARMGPDTILRDVTTWRTFLVLSANQSFADVLLKFKQNTDAGLLRLLEVELPKNIQPFSPAGAVLDQVEANYGWAGRIFLRHLATNHEAIQNYLTTVLDKLSKSLGAQQEERFYVAAIACVIVGIGLASSLELFDFDQRGIYEELKKAFFAARNLRTTRTVITKTGTYDMVQIILDMYADMANERLITSWFKHADHIKVGGMPRTNTVWMQLSVGDKVLRVMRGPMYAWLRKQGYTAKIVLDELTKLGATPDRQTVGGGTQYSMGQQYVVDIPLTGEFKGLLDTTPLPMDNL